MERVYKSAVYEFTSSQFDRNSINVTVEQEDRRKLSLQTIQKVKYKIMTDAWPALMIISSSINLAGQTIFCSTSSTTLHWG